ncbi:ABC transporter ATP-binding protein [Actinoalloteichus sp. AHMU CJ021]|nr:ATP-binding cassette domain-containing protein [Actinoalloteichus caeruleus]AUS80680.1 ABC transporter ATP-binding protein [Actinoalloteichus sp. AHMU CJ021]
MSEQMTTPAPSGEGPALRLRGVDVSYSTQLTRVPVLSGVDLAVSRGEFVILAGPSGSGKSTLLRVLALVSRPAAGSVHVLGRDVTRAGNAELRRLRSRQVTLVYQNPGDNLFDYLSVAENLRARAQLAGREDPGPALLERMGLGGTGSWPTQALSGGQQQRLALACAVGAGADVVLADEPTSQLDHRSAELVVETLTQLHGLGVTLVVASHDPRLLELGPRVVRIRDGHLHSGAAKEGTT